MNNLQLEVGDVVRYKSEQYHCRESLAVAFRDYRGEITLADTFWSSPYRELTKPDSEQTIVSPSEYELLFNLDAYERVDYESTWEKYRPSDRQIVTAQHGHTRMLYVRKGAEPDHDTQIGNAQARLDKAKDDVRRAEYQLAERRRELLELQGVLADEKPEIAEEPAPVVDLMAALEASLAKARADEKSEVK